MKKATFDMGHTADTTQFFKLMETFVGYVGRSGRTYTEQLWNVLDGDIDVLPTIGMPTKPTDEVLKTDAYGLEKAVYLEDRKTALKK